jgi:hypothetical protein
VLRDATETPFDRHPRPQDVSTLFGQRRRSSPELSDSSAAIHG